MNIREAVVLESSSLPSQATAAVMEWLYDALGETADPAIARNGLPVVVTLGERQGLFNMCGPAGQARRLNSVNLPHLLYHVRIWLGRLTYSAQVDSDFFEQRDSNAYYPQGHRS